MSVLYYHIKRAINSAIDIDEKLSELQEAAEYNKITLEEILEEAKKMASENTYDTTTALGIISERLRKGENNMFDINKIIEKTPMELKFETRKCNRVIALDNGEKNS